MVNIESIDMIIGLTIDGDYIRIVTTHVLTEDRSPFLLYYTKYQYDILNQEGILMGRFEIDKNTKPDGSIYFDEGEVETERYGYARKGIISQIYCTMNAIIYRQYGQVLYSDRSSISAKMSYMWQKLVYQGKAEFLGYNNTGFTYFDSKPGPTPLFRMLPPQ